MKREAWRADPYGGPLRRRFVVDGEAYDVALAVPPAPAAALLLVPDGSLHFAAAAGAAAALARRPAKTGVGPTVVVGIASGADWSHDAERRARDLPPGGAEAARFAALVRDVVLPEVAEMVQAAPARTGVFGHSFGGLFALAALAAGGFGRGIAISPSLWRAPPPAPGATRPPLLVVSGGRETEINRGLDAADDALRATFRMRRIVLPDEDHGAAPFAALPAALRFLHAAEEA